MYGNLFATASLAPAAVTPVPEPASFALAAKDGRGEPHILAEAGPPHFIANSASFLGTGVFFRVA